MSSPKVTATKHLIFLKIYSLTRKAQFKPLIEYEIRTSLWHKTNMLAKSIHPLKIKDLKPKPKLDPYTSNRTI